MNSEPKKLSNDKQVKISIDAEFSSDPTKIVDEIWTEKEIFFLPSNHRDVVVGTLLDKNAVMFLAKSGLLPNQKSCPICNNLMLKKVENNAEDISWIYRDTKQCKDVVPIKKGIAAQGLLDPTIEINRTNFTTGKDIFGLLPLSPSKQSTIT